MIGLLVSTLLLAAQPSAAEEVSVLVLDLTSSGMDERQAAVINDIVGQSVARKDLKVTTAADVRRMADVETSKALLGCDTDTSCLADLAGDFGARYVLYGSSAALGDLFVVQLTLFDAEKAEAVERVRVETRDLARITTEIDDAVDRVFAPLLGVSPAPAPVASEPISTSIWVMAGGAGTVVAGALLLGVSALPAARHAELQQDLASLKSEYDAGRQAALSDAAGVQDEIAGQALGHVLLLASGAAVAVIGAGIFTTGAILGATE